MSTSDEQSRPDWFRRVDFYVYVHRRLDTGEVFYVGKGTGRRINCSTGRNPLWTRVSKKHGLIAEKIAEHLTEKEAFRIEMETISLLSPPCNFTAGGEGISGYRHTPETKERLHNAHFQRKQSPEAIEKRTAKLRGKKRSKEFCEAVHKRKIGQKHTLETRQKMRASHTGLRNNPTAVEKTAQWHRGKKRSDQARKRMSEAHLRSPIVCAETGSIFPSITEAAQWLRENGHPKATKTGVWMSLSGKHKTSYGYAWSRYGSS